MQPIERFPDGNARSRLPVCGMDGLSGWIEQSFNDSDGRTGNDHRELRAQPISSGRRFHAAIDGIRIERNVYRNV